MFDSRDYAYDLKDPIARAQMAAYGIGQIAAGQRLIDDGGQGRIGAVMIGEEAAVTQRDPGSDCCMLAKLLRVSPAQMSRTRARATSATTRRSRRRRRV